MTKPPLIPALCLTAVAGAVLFWALAMPPRDPLSPAGAAKDAQVLQRRAAEAAATGPEAQHDAVEEAAAKAQTGPPVTTAQAGRIKAARREFLLNPDHWIPEKAEELRAVAQPYYQWRSRWVARILRSQWGDQSFTGTVGMQAYRRKVDALCADLTKLSPGAKKQLDEWEAGKWEGWTPPPPEMEADVLTTQADRASADLLTRQAAVARPLLDEYEYLEDLAQEIKAPHATTPGGKAHGQEFQRGVELAAAEAQLDRVRQEISALAAQTAAERRQWQSRAWDGYVIENTAERPGK